MRRGRLTAAAIAASLLTPPALAAPAATAASLRVIEPAGVSVTRQLFLEVGSLRLASALSVRVNGDAYQALVLESRAAAAGAPRYDAVGNLQLDQNGFAVVLFEENAVDTPVRRVIAVYN